MTAARLAVRLRYRRSRDPLLRALAAAAEADDVATWLVGGTVRDAALGRPFAGDLDCAAGAGAVRLVRTLERQLGTRGFRFRKRGVTTWRFALGERRIDIVDAGRRGLAADLGRRDLTINAIAFDLRRGRVIDPWRGLADLRAGRLRAPRAGAIREDPVRAVRLARFLAQHPGSRIAPALLREARAAARPLRRAAVERVREELDKLLAAPAPQAGLDLLERTRLLDAILPELTPLRSCRAGAERPDVWRHTVDALAVSAGRARWPGGRALLEDAAARRALRWALLLHDIAKPDTLAYRDDGRPTFHGHEALGAQRAEALLGRLRWPRQERRRVARLILLHLRPSLLAEAGCPGRGMRRLTREAGPDLPLLACHAACDALASGSPDAPARWRRLHRALVALVRDHTARQRRTLAPLIDGRDVMRTGALGPGPLVGLILARVRLRQEEGRVTTREQALELARRIARRAQARGARASAGGADEQAAQRRLEGRGRGTQPR